MKKIEFKYYRKEIEELEMLKNVLTSFKPIDINPELVKQVYTSGYGIADPQKPILATDGIYNCIGLLVFDLSKNYAFLAHSYGNEAYGIDNSTSPSQIYDGDYHQIPRGITRGSAIHVVEMIGSLSKKELYQLKICILIGSKPNVPLVSSMINTIMCLRKKRISIESIKLMKPFIEGIHTENDFNHGKNVSYYDLIIANRDKEIVKNEITGETHSYDETRGSSFAFDARNGRMLTYNSNTKQYYTYDERLSVDIK